MPQGAGALIAFGAREPALPQDRQPALALLQPHPFITHHTPPPHHPDPFTPARATETFIHLANLFGRRPVLLTGWLAYGVMFTLTLTRPLPDKLG